MVPVDHVLLALLELAENSVQILHIFVFLLQFPF